MTGNTWVMSKNMNKGKKSNEDSSPLYKAYTQIVIYKHNPKSVLSYKTQLVHPRPQAPLLILEYPCWLSLV